MAVFGGRAVEGWGAHQTEETGRLHADLRCPDWTSLPAPDFEKKLVKMDFSVLNLNTILDLPGSLIWKAHKLIFAW